MILLTFSQFKLKLEQYDMSRMELRLDTEA